MTTPVMKRRLRVKNRVTAAPLYDTYFRGSGGYPNTVQAFSVTKSLRIARLRVRLGTEACSFHARILNVRYASVSDTKNVTPLGSATYQRDTAPAASTVDLMFASPVSVSATTGYHVLFASTVTGHLSQGVGATAVFAASSYTSVKPAPINSVGYRWYAPDNNNNWYEDINNYYALGVSLLTLSS